MRILTSLAVTAALLTLALPAAAAAVAAPAAVSAAIWGAPQSLPGNSALGGTLQPSALSCDGLGDCVAVGRSSQQLPGVNPRYGVAQEKYGIWGTASPLPGLGKQYAGDDPVSVYALSCGAPGSCVLGGEYGYFPSGSTYDAFISVEKNGAWAPAEDVPGLDAKQALPMSAVSSVSCASAGNCLVGGYYQVVNPFTGPTEQAAMIDTERNGAWGEPEPVPGAPLARDVGDAITAVSCSSPGNCGAAGYTETFGNGTGYHAFVANETAGRWHSAVRIPAMGQITSLSCTAANDCVAAGWEMLAGECPAAGGCQAAFAAERNGTWSALRTVVGAGASKTETSTFTTLSCASTGNCVLGGNIGHIKSSDDVTDTAFLLEQKHNAWSGPRTVPGLPASAVDASVAAVSCPAAGYCDAGGSYTSRSGRQTGFTITESRGTWAEAATVALGAVPDISCYSAASCAAVVAGTVTTGTGPQTSEDVMDKAPVQEHQHSPVAVHGQGQVRQEQAERISVAVSAPLGRPTGAVTITTGGTRLCVIGLVNGRGTCALAPKALGVGTYKLLASYLGEPQFKGSRSPAKSLTVS